MPFAGVPRDNAENNAVAEMSDRTSEDFTGENKFSLVCVSSRLINTFVKIY